MAIIRAQCARSGPDVMAKNRRRAIGKTVLSAILAGAVCWTLPSNAAPLDDAAALYENQDYAGARDIWAPLAEQGSATAQRYLGILYENGLGVPRDFARAIQLYRQAADQDDADAELRLGEAYLMAFDMGVDFPHVPEKGIALMEKAAGHGDPRHMNVVGQFLEGGRWGVPKDDKRAVEYYKKAAALGDSSAEFRLGLAYEIGRGVEQNSEVSNRWYEKAAQDDLAAAQAGDRLAQISVARSYELGMPFFKRDEEAALAWYKKALAHPGRMKDQIERHIARLEQRRDNQQ